jgi:hypothetical protein
LKLEYLDIDFAPVYGIPSIPFRVHGIWTPNYCFYLALTVLPSAYPPAFPKAFASEAISPTVRLAADYLLR